MKKLSKRGKLYVANIVAFAVMIMFLTFEWAVNGYGPHLTALKYLLIQCAFTFLSLIVYYLSIMADAMTANIKEKNGATECGGGQNKKIISK